MMKTFMNYIRAIVPITGSTLAAQSLVEIGTTPTTIEAQSSLEVEFSVLIRRLKVDRTSERWTRLLVTGFCDASLSWTNGLGRTCTDTINFVRINTINGLSQTITYISRVIASSRTDQIMAVLRIHLIPVLPVIPAKILIGTLEKSLITVLVRPPIATINWCLSLGLGLRNRVNEILPASESTPMYLGPYRVDGRVFQRSYIQR